MSRESFKQTLGHGLLSFGAVALIGLVGSVIIARIYGVDVIGEYAITLAPVGVLTYISTVQEQAALIRALSVLEARDPRVTGLAAAVFGFSSLVTLVIGVIVSVISGFLLAGPMGHPGLVTAMVAQVAGYVFITNTCWNVDSVLNAFRSGRQLLWVRLVQALGFLIIAVAYGLIDATVWGLVWATIGSWAFSMVPRVRALGRVMLWRVPRTELEAGVRALPEMIRFGVKAAPGGMVVGINAEAGTWILGFTSSLPAVGAWNRARQLGDRLKEGTIRLNEALLPTLVERRNQGDDEGHDRAWADSVRYGLAGMLLVAAVGGGAGEGVMNIFGPGFAQGSTALALILVYQALQAVDSMHITALYAADRPLLTTVASTVGMVVGVGVAIPMSIWEGVTGPAIGLVLGIFASTCVMHGSVRRMLNTPLAQLWPPRQMMSIAVAYAAGFAAAYAVDHAMGGHLGTLVALAAGTVAYLAGFLAPGGLGERDRDRIRAVRARLSRGPAAA